MDVTQYMSADNGTVVVAASGGSLAVRATVAENNWAWVHAGTSGRRDCAARGRREARRTRMGSSRLGSDEKANAAPASTCLLEERKASTSGVRERSFTAGDLVLHPVAAPAAARMDCQQLIGSCAFFAFGPMLHHAPSSSALACSSPSVAWLPEGGLG